MSDEYPEFDIEKICEKFGISQNNIENLPITMVELEKIYNGYISAIPTLESLNKEILSLLNEVLVGKAHSVRGRIKHPEHLIEKIIRNSNERPDKYEGINAKDYFKLVTDLIGFRVIVINKKDWKAVHDKLLDTFHNDPARYQTSTAYSDVIHYYDKYSVEAGSAPKRMQTCFHAEKPQVYITSEDDRKVYVDEFLRVDNSKTHYRSLHYIIRYGKYYFEIQVRTIFEEGWLEFDHRITYPYDKANIKKKAYLNVLSSLASAADQLISFYDENDFEDDRYRDGPSSVSEKNGDEIEGGKEKHDDTAVVKEETTLNEDFKKEY